MEEERGGCDAGTADQLFAPPPLQISDIGVAVCVVAETSTVRHACPHFQNFRFDSNQLDSNQLDSTRLDSKLASQCLCFDVTLPFSSIMTRAPSTTIHRSKVFFPTALLDPIPAFRLYPTSLLSPLSSLPPPLPLSSPLNSRSSAFLPASLPIEPENAHFLYPSPFPRVVHSQPPRSTHAAILPPCKDFSRFSGVVSRLGLDDGIPISVHRSAIPELYRTKGTCVTYSKERATCRRPHVIAAVTGVFEDIGLAGEKLDHESNGGPGDRVAVTASLLRRCLSVER